MTPLQRVIVGYYIVIGWAYSVRYAHWVGLTDPAKVWNLLVGSFAVGMLWPVSALAEAHSGYVNWQMRRADKRAGRPTRR